MRFVVIDGDIHIATSFDMDTNRDTVNIGTRSQGKSHTKATTAMSFEGKMLLFTRSGFPNFFDGIGMPNKFDMAFIGEEYPSDEDVLMTATDVLFRNFEPLSAYSCDAAYVEWMASDLIPDQYPKSINMASTTIDI